MILIEPSKTKATLLAIFVIILIVLLASVITFSQSLSQKTLIATNMPRSLRRKHRNQDSYSADSADVLNPRVAILITGQMRFSGLEHIQWFSQALKHFDLYISTEDVTTALHITTNDQIITPEDILKTPIRKRQWLHLHELLNSFKYSEYEIICKLRTDFVFERPLVPRDFNHVRPGYVYARSDHGFYADTSTFLKVFGTFWNEIPKYQAIKYFPLPYENMRKSESGALSDTYSTRDIPTDTGLVAGRFVFPTFVREDRSTPWKTVLERISRGHITDNGPYYGVQNTWMCSF